MKQQLRKPELWQDFEELCKMLWGEIWVCPEIKRNGRNGNAQHGVDIYGVPNGQSEYYGIQCKGKDYYTHAQLTETEIDKEIAKAKTFKPQLKKFYFATTANKDAVIEEYVRLKDLESRKAGSFEIHLFSWEDIVFLIDENKRTHDWYVKKINFKTLYAVKVLFGIGQDTIEFHPTLLRHKVSYRLKEREKLSYNFNYLHGAKDPKELRNEKLSRLIDPQPIRYYMNGNDVNKSACEFYLTIKNIGDSVIEDYKLNFDLVGEIIKADSTNKQDKFLDMYKYTYNAFIYEDSTSGVFKPSNKTLVQNDFVATDKICFRPSENEQTVLLNWELVARDFTTSGQLTINIFPKIKEKSSVEYFEEPLEDEIRIENYFGNVD
ncbi:MAG: hypothetical protein MUC87_00695 [Bacteroidia bacterium]|nr:hypothetical protein [Bacteroidia bacterium]